VKSEGFFYICAVMESQWKKQLRREASAHHMCAENRSALEAVETKEQAVEIYKKTIDWALEEGYPDLDTIRKNFSDCEDLGIFVDKHFHGEMLTRCQIYVFHNCTGTIRTGLNLNKRIIPMLYFANGCDMDVRGIEGSRIPVRVPLYIFGNNRIGAENSDKIICKTYQFATK